MPFFSPVSAGGIGKATVTATTGSPNIDTTTRSGKTIYKFTGSGTITIGKAGTAEILVVGGGGGGARGTNSGGGGAGGLIYDTSALLPAGTLTVTVGAGGTGGYNDGNRTFDPAFNGASSRLGTYYALVGGGGAGDQPGRLCGSGGATAQASSGAGAGTPGQGFGGSTGQPAGGGGSGGAGSAGAAGVGTAISITGTSVTYAAGGRQGANNAAANTGNGGDARDTTGCNGGSGIVIVVIG